jgi:hypothetical protein
VTLQRIYPVSAGIATYASTTHCSSVSNLQTIKLPPLTFSVFSDCKYNNIMADVLPLYESPPHPFRIRKTRDYSAEAQTCSTRTRTPVKYYFVDFGLSRRYNPEDGPPLELPRWGGDKSVPEFLAADTPCDPFPVDVYCLGNVIRQSFIEVRSLFPTIIVFFSCCCRGIPCFLLGKAWVS